MPTKIKTGNLKSLDFVITPLWIRDNHACDEGAAWGIATVGEGLSLREFIPKFEREGWLLWMLKRTKSFTKIQYVELAIICAQTVLEIFEEKYPKDKRPRKAIEAAIKYCHKPTEENRTAADAAYAAANAAANAAYAAADAAADAAAYAAANAAYAAAYAAYAAADAAANAAYAAADAAYVAANAAYVAAKKAHHKTMCKLLAEKIQEWDRETK